MSRANLSNPSTQIHVTRITADVVEVAIQGVRDRRCITWQQLRSAAGQYQSDDRLREIYRVLLGDARQMAHARGMMTRVAYSGDDMVTIPSTSGVSPGSEEYQQVQRAFDRLHALGVLSGGRGAGTRMIISTRWLDPDESAEHDADMAHERESRIMMRIRRDMREQAT